MHTAYTACAATDLSRMTDILTDTANIGKNSQHLMHSMQPKTRSCITAYEWLALYVIYDNLHRDKTVIAVTNHCNCDFVNSHLHSVIVLFVYGHCSSTSSRSDSCEFVTVVIC